MCRWAIITTSCAAFASAELVAALVASEAQYRQTNLSISTDLCKARVHKLPPPRLYESSDVRKSNEEDDADSERNGDVPELDGIIVWSCRRIGRIPLASLITLETKMQLPHLLRQGT